ncbi:hypothetical protein JCM19232_3379 [Vibrio ishigakensis]|uniref:Uncharacterized protein n=1 Tax=Vibrio ishigakensis TaxID=1481914 RepID=A0A0B8P3J9_9VIBR|nr:hypothetical protein [Vibrio ishigakensis]GAM57554.1 hypothetical protein JCM19231_2673 [Vibrio ishigakensis]GAM64103.1 hypothetical protein JCM19232_3379 [Vibrio ishigakensis]
MADNTEFYFHDYNEWRQAITERCNIKLTPEYSRSRIAALQDSSDRTTQEFTEKYGEAYLSQVISWFQQAETESNQ